MLSGWKPLDNTYLHLFRAIHPFCRHFALGRKAKWLAGEFSFYQEFLNLPMWNSWKLCGNTQEYKPTFISLNPKIKDHLSSSSYDVLTAFTYLFKYSSLQFFRKYLLTSSYVPCVCEYSVTQLCPTLCNPMDFSLPGSSAHGIFQARIVDWVAVSFSRGIFLTQGLNPHLLCPLNWQAGSLPLVPVCTIGCQ